MNKEKFLRSMIDEIEVEDIIAADNTATIVVEIVKKMRDLDMTEEGFADYMGVTKDTVLDWESGNHDFTISEISKIFVRLDVEWRIQMKRD